VGFVDTLRPLRRVTFELRQHFLVVAGLLNYLAMLDAFDIAAGESNDTLLWIAVSPRWSPSFFGAVAKGTSRHRLIYGLKVFAQFLLTVWRSAGLYIFSPSLK